MVCGTEFDTLIPIPYMGGRENEGDGGGGVMETRFLVGISGVLSPMTIPSSVSNLVSIGIPSCRTIGNSNSFRTNLSTLQSEKAQKN
eukprot:748820-Hanusia_phi.AAC.4